MVVVVVSKIIWVVARHSRTGDYTGALETKVDDQLFWNFV